MSDFSSLGISEGTYRKLNSYGIVAPTPIQEQAIPIILSGKDLIGQAQTGTGKTLAFILPILERIERNSPAIQALIVAPTRELALQITEETNKLIAEMEGLYVLAAYGGQDVEKQLRGLQNGVQIVVGTPGRLLDHIRRKTIVLDEVSFLVLDEADQMLHIGFLDEVETIIKETPLNRQTMLFSATIPPEIKQISKKYMSAPKSIQIEKTQGPAQTVKQLAIHTTDRAKQGTLIKLLESHRPYLAVIFCRTKRRVSKLYSALREKGFLCDELHGDLSQAKREQTMKRFREREIKYLIATDVAARGLDIEGVTHVFNYDIPQDSESYIHRIGRTGRAGMTGLAITLYSSADRSTLDSIENELNIGIPKKNIGNANSIDSAPHTAKKQRNTNRTTEKVNLKQNKPIQKKEKQGERKSDIQDTSKSHKRGNHSTNNLKNRTRRVKKK